MFDVIALEIGRWVLSGLIAVGLMSPTIIGLNVYCKKHNIELW